MISQAELKQLLTYNLETGVWYWNSDGREAGCYNKRYASVGIKYKTYALHQLAFLYVIGRIPKCVDHKNRNTLDNTWSNLREVTFSQNSHNVGISVRNKSGVKGVSWDTARGKWAASVCVNKKNMRLGRFNSIEEAKQAVDSARRKLV